MTNIKQFNLNENTISFIQGIGFTEFTPIQQKVIPLVLKGRDVVGVADTGTGKTHSFLIPILDQIDPTKNYTQAIIIAPTRELARQIYEAAKKYKDYVNNIDITLISSENSKDKMSGLLKKNPQIVIGTPGRIKDAFLDDRILRLEKANILVIDEADMTLEYGFINDVDAIAGHLKKDLQLLAFSATVPQQLKVFLEKYMHNPATVVIKNDENYFANVKHKLIPAKHHTYLETLLRILPGINPYLCLIFTNTRLDATKVASAMREEGYKLIELHGDLTTRQRKNAMKEIDNGNCPYIVATDIAARGIDIPGISHVISLGFPTALEYYIHRAGRTGRIKHEGICYAIYNPNDDKSIKELKKQGIHFDHVDYRGGQWNELKPYGYKRTRPITETEKEIRKITSKKPKKVTPGYKKKRAATIEKIKQKHKRELIQKSIREQAHQKNRLKQREKYQQE